MRGGTTIGMNPKLNFHLGSSCSQICGVRLRGLEAKCSLKMTYVWLNSNFGGKRGGWGDYLYAMGMISKLNYHVGNVELIYKV